jgi:hypothetical protein
VLFKKWLISLRSSPLLSPWLITLFPNSCITHYILNDGNFVILIFWKWTRRQRTMTCTLANWQGLWGAETPCARGLRAIKRRQQQMSQRCGHNDTQLLSSWCESASKLSPTKSIHARYVDRNLEKHPSSFCVISLTYLLTYLITHSMVQDIWKADCHSACQKISCFLMEPEVSLLCSHKPATRPYPEPTESSSPHRSLSP